MSKVLKGLILDELQTTIDSLDGGVFVTYAGLDSEKMYALRSALHAEGVSMQVVPNRIAIRALQKKRAAQQPDADVADLKQVLKGDNALIYGETTIIAARAVRKQIRAGVAIKWKGAFLEGEVFDAAKAPKVADLPTREEVLSQIAFCFNASAQRIAGVFQQTYKQIAGCFLSLKDKIEEEGGPIAPAAGASAAAATGAASGAEASGEGGAEAASAPAEAASEGASAPVEGVAEAGGAGEGAVES